MMTCIVRWSMCPNVIVVAVIRPLRPREMSEVFCVWILKYTAVNPSRFVVSIDLAQHKNNYNETLC